MKRALALGFAAASALVTRAEAEHGALDGAATVELMSGAHATGIAHETMLRWHAHFAPDGTYVWRVPGGGTSTAGRWQVDGSRWCTEPAGRSRHCELIEHLGGNEYQFTDPRGGGLKFRVSR